MSRSIKEILKDIKNKGYIDLDYDESKVVLDYITNLEKALKKMTNEQIDELEKEITKVQEENAKIQQENAVLRTVVPGNERYYFSVR